MVDVMMDDIPDITFEFEKGLDKKDFDFTSNTNGGPVSQDDYQQKPGEICKFYLKGSCMKGSQCQYRHSRNDRAVVCKHWLRGLCKKGDLCEFLHEYDLDKMPECYFFSKFGECSNPECLYLHIAPEEKMKECPWYARGFCKHGPRCRHKHAKKIACENYLLGFCPDGPKCKYGHPKYELPKEESDATAANKKSRTPMICHKCGHTGHKAASCPINQKEIQDNSITLGPGGISGRAIGLSGLPGLMDRDRNDGYRDRGDRGDRYGDRGDRDYRGGGGGGYNRNARTGPDRDRSAVEPGMPPGMMTSDGPEEIVLGGGGGGGQGGPGGMMMDGGGPMNGGMGRGGGGYQNNMNNNNNFNNFNNNMNNNDPNQYGVTMQQFPPQQQNNPQQYYQQNGGGWQT